MGSQNEVVSKSLTEHIRTGRSVEAYLNESRLGLGERYSRLNDYSTLLTAQRAENSQLAKAVQSVLHNTFGEAPVSSEALPDPKKLSGSSLPNDFSGRSLPVNSNHVINPAVSVSPSRSILSALGRLIVPNSAQTALGLKGHEVFADQLGDRVSINLKSNPSDVVTREVSRRSEGGNVVDAVVARDHTDLLRTYESKTIPAAPVTAEEKKALDGIEQVFRSRPTSPRL